MSHTLIIAEAGVNHNGSLETAKKMAMTAKECGADIVKFQTAKLDSLVSHTAKLAEYQKENIGLEISQREMLKKLLLTYGEFAELSDYCKELGIKFLSTPFDLESIDFLDGLGCAMWKIDVYKRQRRWKTMWLLWGRKIMNSNIKNIRFILNELQVLN